MNYETVDVVIHPDGRIEIRVHGVKGATCLEVTSELEAALGSALEKTITSEYSEKPPDLNEAKKRRNVGG